MPKYHPYSRREFRRLFLVWVRRNLMGLAGIGIAMLIAVAIVTSWLLAATDDASVLSWFLGAFQVAMLAIYLHLVHTAFFAHEADAIRHVRGAWGEDNTRDELRRAERKKVIWGSIDSLPLQHGDIDHLVVTRRGGLVAIDSKWRSQVNDTADMARAAARVRMRAEALTRDLLRGETRGARRARVNPLTVTSVVVLWGAAQHGVPEGASVDGIEFIAGRRLRDWLARLDGQPVDEEAATEILRKLEVRRATTAKAIATSRTTGTVRSS